MKKSMMIAATLTMGGAGIAQSDMSSSEGMTSGYPGCSATVTDRCIQLYERGVRSSANLAMNANMSTSSAAVGGPYEPVTAHSGTMIHDAVGGPVEERTGYPPCTRPGPGQDSCIQLYERGVTGAGN